MKIVGIQSVVSTTNAGEETSQAVYPRASKVLRMPPLGKRSIRLLLNQQFSGESFNDSAVFAEFDKAVMLFGGSVCQRLKPVCVVSDVE